MLEICGFLGVCSQIREFLLNGWSSELNMEFQHIRATTRMIVGLIYVALALGEARKG